MSAPKQCWLRPSQFTPTVLRWRGGKTFELRQLTSANSNYWISSIYLGNFPFVTRSLDFSKIPLTWSDSLFLQVVLFTVLPLCNNLNPVIWQCNFTATITTPCLAMDRLYGEKLLLSNETVKILAGGHKLQKGRWAEKRPLIGSTSKTSRKERTNRLSSVK